MVGSNAENRSTFESNLLIFIPNKFKLTNNEKEFIIYVCRGSGSADGNILLQRA